MPCQIEDISIIDAVVLSYDYYDHTNHPTIMKIKAEHFSAHFFVPLCNKQWFTASGIHEVTELNWCEERDFTLKPVHKGANIVSQTEKQSSTEGRPSESIIARIGYLSNRHTSV